MIHLYFAEVNYATQPSQHELGLREFRYYPIHEFQEMIRHSEIQDSITLAAWCRYQLLQNSPPNNAPNS